MNNIAEIKTRLKKLQNEQVKINGEIAAIKEELKKSGDVGIKRKPKGEMFYGVAKEDGLFAVQPYRETNNDFCNKCFENNNYYLTKDRCKEVVDKCNFLVLLERIHDELCPDYKPQIGKQAFAITQIFDASFNGFGAYVTLNIVPHGTYFPTLDVALQASNILNKKWKAVNCKFER